MNDTLKLIETRTINNALVNGYYGKKEAWFTRDEIGSVLGYADPPAVHSEYPQSSQRAVFG